MVWLWRWEAGLRWGVYSLLFALVFVIIPLSVMAPYLAAHFANIFNKPYTDRQPTATGGLVTAVHNRRMMQPAWLTLPRRAVITDADRSVDSGKPGSVGSVEFTAWQSFPVLKAVYTESLGKQGFTATDLGLGPPDEESAKILGTYGTIVARSGDGREEVTIAFDEDKGLLQTVRHIQIGWKEGRVAQEQGSLVFPRH
jgi:hypothetical protein